jgi:dTDP-4-amino-4,6-dideoxygalactose transaminase
MLRVKLKYLDRENTRRAQIADKYAEGLVDIPIRLPATLPRGRCGSYAPTRHVYHQFVIRTKNRDGLRMSMLQKLVMSSIHYRVPLHKQPAFAPYHSKKCALPEVRTHCEQCVSLPMYPELTDEEVERVIAAVRRFYEQMD